MTQQQKKFILAYQFLDSTVPFASRSSTVVNETNGTYEKFGSQNTSDHVK